MVVVRSQCWFRQSQWPMCRMRSLWASSMGSRSWWGCWHQQCSVRLVWQVQGQVPQRRTASLWCMWVMVTAGSGVAVANRWWRVVACSLVGFAG